MAAITAAELSYSVAEEFIAAPGRVRRKVLVSFPTGANAGTNNAYVPGGIPLALLSLDLRSRVQRLSVIGRTPVAGANNPRWEWNGDSLNPTLVAFANAGAAGPDTELTSAVTFASPQSLVCDVEGF